MCQKPMGITAACKMNNPDALHTLAYAFFHNGFLSSPCGDDVASCTYIWRYTELACAAYAHSQNLNLRGMLGRPQCNTSFGDSSIMVQEIMGTAAFRMVSFDATHFMAYAGFLIFQNDLLSFPCGDVAPAGEFSV